MSDRMFWEYLEELPEQEAAWYEYYRCLSGWHCFNTFYTHYLKVKGNRAMLLKCTELCDYDCPRRVIEDSPSNITAVCPQDKADPIQLKFRDILIYSLRREALHKAICVSLKITYSGDRQLEYGDTWHLGDYSGTEVYLTYRTVILVDTISSLYLSHQKPFILMVPTAKNITSEIQQFLEKNNSVLFSIDAELSLQPDGSFKPVRGISERITRCNHYGQQVSQNTALPIEAYQ